MQIRGMVFAVFVSLSFLSYGYSFGSVSPTYPKSEIVHVTKEEDGRTSINQYFLLFLGVLLFIVILLVIAVEGIIHTESNIICPYSGPCIILH